MRKYWIRFLAFHRLSLDAVCEASAGKGLDDYHDYPDAKGIKEPWHFHTYKCERCEKEFYI